MRRLVAITSLIAVALVVGACAASQAPNWTFAPPTAAPTPGPSQSGAPASAPASAPAEASAPASSGGGGGSATVNITALNIAFTTPAVSAPADVPFTIHFDNQDQGIPHDVVIKDASGATVFQGDLVTGVAQADYSVPALKAGTYPFICSVHPNMTGTLTVGS